MGGRKQILLTFDIAQVTMRKNVHKKGQKMKIRQSRSHPVEADYAGMTKEQIARSKAYEALLDAHNEALHDAKWGETDTVKEEHLLEILRANPDVVVQLDG